MTTSKGNSASDFIKSVGFIALKSYNEYDAYGRISVAYKAPMQTEVGGLCVKSTMTYDGTTNRMVKSKEELSTWPEGADI